jgi:hypothetical protein
VLGIVGVPELLIILGIFAIPIVGTIILLMTLLRSVRRQARSAGYPSTRAYLRSAPQTDQEKKDAADLALKGLAICLLGLMFSPLILVGLFPFFYGARKVVYASMGLGLIDDAERRRS